MEWVFYIVIAVTFCLYVWSRVTDGYSISKKIQPFVDEFFGVTPSKSGSKPKPPANPKAE